MAVWQWSVAMWQCRRGSAMQAWQATWQCSHRGVIVGAWQCGSGDVSVWKWPCGSGVVVWQWRRVFFCSMLLGGSGRSALQSATQR